MPMTGPDALAERIEATRDGGHRLLVALAGPPAAGKSRLAALMVERLERAIVVPMDGFHLDNVLLDRSGLRHVKGSPETFDVEGLDVLLQRIAADTGPVHVPVFDRAADLSRAAAATVSPEHRIILVEGNYLLLEEPGWRKLSRHFALTVMIDVDVAVLEQRLLERWRRYGLDPAAAAERARGNDLPNGRRILQRSMSPDIRYVG